MQESFNLTTIPVFRLCLRTKRRTIPVFRLCLGEPKEEPSLFLGYVLEYQKKNQPATRENVDLPGTVTSFTVRDLVPVTNYTIYVAARTRVGAGQVASADIQSGVPPGRN